MRERDQQLSQESQIRFDRAKEATGIIIKVPERVPELRGKIKRVIVFGSTVTDKATPISDIDMCVTFAELTNHEILFYSGDIKQALKNEGGFVTGVHVPMGLDMTFIPDENLSLPEGLPEIERKLYADINEQGIVLYPLAEPIAVVQQ
ncbi:MAG: nucleotidyltransferase domain-containing protein [Candidatus Levybacteria bacterium]|nr:nucleotidyltransferase domain-containing protein [Candidatus Levybacteria bacterium]